MDDHNFMHFSWSPKRDHHQDYDEIIEQDEIDELNDMIEEQVEGYEEVNILEENSDNDNASYNYIDEHIEAMIPENDTQNLYHLNDDGIMSNSARIGVGMSHLIEQRVQEAENKIIGDQDVQEEFTAEVITEEDWIQSQGEDVVPVAMEQIVTSGDYQEDETDAVPLQTDQDEYTTSRPYPCDFCSRRFRKKANLINHMVAHQNIRPHMCNLCGSRYVRKCDLINHLKIHAYNIDGDDQMVGPSTSGGKKKPTMKYDELSFLDMPDEDDDDDDGFDYNHYSKPTQPVKKNNIKSTKSTGSSSGGVGLGAGKGKKTPVKKPARFEKITKEKSLTDFNITIAKEPKKEYVERFPITDARKPFVCQTCGVAFTREKALESHQKLHVNQEPTIDCEVCGDSFFDNAQLEEHMEIRHDYSARFKKTGGKTTGGKVPPSRSQFVDFDDSASSEFEPDKHIDEIENDSSDYEDNKHECDKCEMSFKTSEALKRHIKTHFIKSEVCSEDDDEDDSNVSGQQQRGKKGNATNLGCNVCGESFTEALDLLAHAEIHARFQPFKCLLCGETFFEENKIKMHLMENHRDEMTESSCKLCGKQCRDQRSLIKHSWEHSRDRAHSCSKCGKTFHNKARLKRHISSHRNKSVVCEICHEEFSDGRQLMNHRHSHTKSNQFPCNECGKTFGSRSSQQIHIRIHTGERPYSCRFCWKAFADGGTLRKHERIHTGEKPYCCLVCPRAFNQRVVLREHIRSHHSAPDPQNGTTLTPYYCTLCGDLFSASLDLIHHLIEHSDRSTAAKRVQPTGPRKYKRRRKLSDADSSQNSISETKFSPRKAIKQEPIDTPSKSSFISSAELNKISKTFVEFQLPDEFFDVAPSRENKKEQPAKKSLSSSSRAKMIFTEKTRVPVYDGKRKTRTMIQKQVLGHKQLSKIKSQQTNNDSGSETCSNEDDPNEDALNVLLKRERKLSEKFTIDLVNDLQEILRSPLKINEKMIEEEELLDNSNNSKIRRSVRQTPSKYGSTRKNSITKKDNESETEDISSDQIVIKEEFLDGQTCEICGDSFESREELLSHVPIHI